MIDEVGCPQCGHGSRGLAGYQSGRADEVEETLKAPSVMQTITTQQAFSHAI